MVSGPGSPAANRERQVEVRIAWVAIVGGRGDRLRELREVAVTLAAAQRP